MIKKRKFFCFLFLFAVLFLFFKPFSLCLADEVGIKIIPSIIDELVVAGQTMNKEIKVSNESLKPITLYAYLRDFKAADEYGQAELIVPGTEDGNYISSWVKISSEAVVLEAGAERSIPFSIKIPEDTGPGGYYGAIVFGTEPPKIKPGESEKGAAIGISQQAASLILLQIAGEVDESADIREFRTDKKLYSTPFNVNFTLKVENKGNVHIKPRGSIEIKNMFGKRTAIINVNDRANNVLPKTNRIFSASWKDSFGFGKYQAEAALSYGTDSEKGGEGKKTMIMIRYFWVLPMKILTIIGAVLAGLIFIFFVFLRFYKRLAIRRAMERANVRAWHPGRGVYQKQSRQFVIIFLSLFGFAVFLLFALYFLLF